MPQFLNYFLYFISTATVLTAGFFVYLVWFQPPFYFPKPTAQKAFDCSHKDSILDAALTMELPLTNTIVSEEANQFDKKAFQKVHEGDYEEAIKIILSGLNKLPNNFTLQADFAGLLGDCSEIMPAPLKNRMAKRSKQLFDKLMHEIDGQPKTDVYDFKNEYYYRFAMYREQYELGRLRVSEYWGTNEWKTAYGFRGYYSQGVGASNYARKLLEVGNNLQAIDYAQKALAAWAQYFTYKNDYYNAYVHYAMALGILGYKDEMLRALSRSASLIKKDLNYHEFKEVIDFIESKRSTLSIRNNR